MDYTFVSVVQNHTISITFFPLEIGGAMMSINKLFFIHPTIEEVKMKSFGIGDTLCFKVTITDTLGNIMTQLDSATIQIDMLPPKNVQALESTAMTLEGDGVASLIFTPSSGKGDYQVKYTANSGGITSTVIDTFRLT